MVKVLLNTMADERLHSIVADGFTMLTGEREEVDEIAMFLMTAVSAESAFSRARMRLFAELVTFSKT